MPFSRRGPHRNPSRLIALATVAAALAAHSAADIYHWQGGNHDNWSDANWDGQYGKVSFSNLTSLEFGENDRSVALPPDTNGLLNNDYGGNQDVEGLYFSRQSWTLTGGYLNVYNSINVADSSPQVSIANGLHLHDFGLQSAYLDLNVATQLTFSGGIEGAGPVNKYGVGTAIFTVRNSYTGNTNVQGGRLIDYQPHGNYNDNAALEFHSDANTTFGGSIAGAGSFTKSGAGDLNLTGSLGYTGYTTVNDGTLILQVPKSSGITILGGAVLETRMTQTFTYAGKITGAGYYVKSGTGSMTLSAANDYTGGTDVYAGSLTDLHPHGNYYNDGTLVFEVADAQTYSGSIFNSGTFFKTGAGTLTRTGVNFYTGTTYVEDGRLIDQNPHGTYRDDAALEFQTTTDQTFAGGIFGAGSLTKSGAGTLTLSAQYASAYPAYDGGTVVNGGRLIEQSPHGNYVTNADLEFQTANDAYLGNISTFTPSIVGGSGNLVKSGAGSLVVFGSNGYAGSTTIDGGAIVALVDNVLPNATALTVNASGAFNLLGTSQTVGALSGAGKVTLGGGALTVGGASSTTFSGVVSDSGSLVKAGSGALTLSGVNTYTGGTTVSGGRLVDLNPHGDYVTNATLEFAKASDSTFGGTIDGTGTFVKSGAGTLALTGSIKPNVTTQIAGGTLKASGGGLYGNVVGGAGTTFQLTGGTYPAAFSGAGALLAGGGVTLAQAPSNAGGVRVTDRDLTIKGAGAFGGGLTVDANATFGNASGGTLIVNGQSLVSGNVMTNIRSTTVFAGPVSGAGNFTGSGKVELDGGYSPGNSPASVSFAGDLALGSANVLTMELGGSALGAGYDHLSVLGAATLGGGLSVASINGFSPALGQSFDLFDFSSSNGTFSFVTLPALGNGLRWDTSALYTTGVVRTQAVPEPGTWAALGLGAVSLLRRRREA